MRPRSGRCRALLWARTNPRLSRRRGSNSTSASPGKGRTKAIRSDRAPQGPVAPWVAAAALSVTEATHGHHGHPGAAVLARFSGSVGFPESRLLSGPIRAWNTWGSGVGSPILRPQPARPADRGPAARRRPRPKARSCPWRSRRLRARAVRAWFCGSMGFRFAKRVRAVGRPRKRRRNYRCSMHRQMIIMTCMANDANQTP